VRKKGSTIKVLFTLKM